MLLLRWFAVTVLSLIISLALCQQPTVPVRFYLALPAPVKQFRQDPSLRSYAIRRGLRIYTEIRRKQSSIVAEEGVNVNIDCFPWLRGYTLSWEVQWVLQRRNESGDSESRTVYRVALQLSDHPIETYVI